MSIQTLRLLALGFLCLGLPLSVQAVSIYNKTHTWNLQLNSKQVYNVAWKGTAQAIAGKPTMERENTVLSGPVRAPTGNTTALQAAASGGASADAISFFTANADGTGLHTMRGMTNLGTGQLAASAASSSIALQRITFDARGRIRWRGQWIIDVIQSGAERDPIMFTVIDLDTNEILESELFSLDVNLLGPGTASWQDGVVSVDALNGSLSLAVDSPFITSGVGRLSAEFVDGLITASVDSGIFDGLLPSIGSGSIFNFNLGGTDGFVDIDFDFGGPNTNGYDITASFSAAAEIRETVPEPATLALLGLGLAGIGFSKRKSPRAT